MLLATQGQVGASSAIGRQLRHINYKLGNRGLTGPTLNGTCVKHAVAHPYVERVGGEPSRASTSDGNTSAKTGAACAGSQTSPSRPKEQGRNRRVCRVAAGRQDDLERDVEDAYRVQTVSASERTRWSGRRAPDSSDAACLQVVYKPFAHEYALVQSSCRRSGKLQVLER
jgi:hypothetical protein